MTSMLIKTCWILLLSGVFLASCDSPKDSMLVREISKELSDTLLVNNLIFIVSDYDCHYCVSSIRNWLDSIQNTPSFGVERVSGLYFGARHEPVHYSVLDTVKFPIHWSFSQNYTLYAQIEHFSDEKKGPFAVKIGDGKLEYVLSVNGNIFR